MILFSNTRNKQVLNFETNPRLESWGSIPFFILRCKISPGIAIKSRDLSAEKAGENLKLFKQPAETSDLVLDVILAERVPIGRRIDGDHTRCPLYPQ